MSELKKLPFIFCVQNTTNKHIKNIELLSAYNVVSRFGRTKSLQPEDVVSVPEGVNVFVPTHGFEYIEFLYQLIHNPVKIVKVILASSHNNLFLRNFSFKHEYFCEKKVFKHGVVIPFYPEEDSYKNGMYLFKLESTYNEDSSFIIGNLCPNETLTIALILE